MASRLLGRVFTESSALFVCDIQQKFVPLIHEMPKLTQHASTLIKGCQELNIPIIGTEQYPKALGNMIDEVHPTTYKIYPKTLFSMYIPDIKSRLKGGDLSHVKSVILTGLETHVCILQTTMDLLEEGYDVHVVRDAVSSQRLYDKDTAIERLRQSGAYITTTESILFQLMKDANHKNFKNISNLVKDHNIKVSKL